LPRLPYRHTPYVASAATPTPAATSATVRPVLLGGAAPVVVTVVDVFVDVDGIGEAVFTGVVGAGAAVCVDVFDRLDVLTRLA
jgi:hypothetical protein